MQGTSVAIPPERKGWSRCWTYRPDTYAENGYTHVRVKGEGVSCVSGTNLDGTPQISWLMQIRDKARAAIVAESDAEADAIDAALGGGRLAVEWQGFVPHPQPAAHREWTDWRFAWPWRRHSQQQLRWRTPKWRHTWRSSSGQWEVEIALVPWRARTRFRVRWRKTIPGAEWMRQKMREGDNKLLADYKAKYGDAK